jgi:hypothetical protein
MKAELLVGATVGTPRETVTLDRDVLTTHGVILGMTGSGKTGLAIVLLEELARRHVPLIVCDLKGDMTNLLLDFPALSPDDFTPYLPATQAGGDRDAAAQAVAAKWRDGLAQWSLGEAEMREVREGVAWRLLTPGSGLAPVNLLPALDPPSGYDPDLDPDGARIRLDGTAAGLLALVGRGGDPLSDRDHVLLATLLDAAWRQGKTLELAQLIGQIADPPVARFGVLDAETFYPRKERQELLRSFNTVLASPSFAAWTRGAALAVDELIGTAETPRATILYLAHLADRERLSFLTLLASMLLSWTRSQPGSESLRTLLYLDEVQGVLPPTAMPPTKLPLLTLLKQGRAFGTGVLLATQNPVDLDYKALGNIGLKLIGRLDTENDRRRALEGLDVADADAGAKVAALEPRQFLLAGARIGPTRVIASRWAMSYLRGPLTLAELKPLVGTDAAATAVRPTAAASAGTGVTVLPGVTQLFADGRPLAPHVVIEAEVVYRKTAPAIERRLTATWCAPLADDRVVWENLRTLAGTALGADRPAGATLAPLSARATGLLAVADKQFAAEMDSRALEVAWHRTLKLVQEDGEPRSMFEERCRQAAPGGAGKEAEVRRRYEDRIRGIDDKLAKQRLALEDAEREASAREREKTIAVATGIGETVLSAVLGVLSGRRSSVGSSLRRGAATVRTYGSKDRMADHAAASVEETRQTIAQLEADGQRLAGELAQELATLQQTGNASGIETLRLTPARKDISVRRVALGWLPAGGGA